MKTQKQIQSFSAKDANFIIKEIRYKKKKFKKKKIMTCKNCLAVSAVWPTAISRKDETILCLSVEESTPSIASLLGPLFFFLFYYLFIALQIRQREKPRGGLGNRRPFWFLFANHNFFLAVKFV